MVLQKVPTFTQVKDWVQNTATANNAANLGGSPPSEYGVPSGAVMMWSGAITDIPSGYYLCDGNNGTPNLQDKFVVGAGTAYGVGDTGGEDQHTLTESEMPSHSHTYQKVSGTTARGSDYSFDVYYAPTSDAETATTGGDAAHENRPPYYAVAYIMKA